MQQKPSNEQTDNILFVLNCFGIITTYAWLMVLKGSKYWQENWELHVDYLEDEQQGILYKYVKTGKGINEKDLLASYSYSVSKINIYLCLFLLAFWVILFFWFITAKYMICISSSSWVIRIGAGLMAIAFIGNADKHCKTKDAEWKMDHRSYDLISRNRYHASIKDKE